ncbi:MAG TPA: ABC transporter permease [Gemmatimonadaceae bacterium]|nr:ABC transporter permease [Gemmatimonadaceae bacterium]
MTRVLALMRAHWQTMKSYRVQTLISFAAIVASIVPLYFVAGAVQPIMSGSIKSEGGSAFGFLAVGYATFMLVSMAVSALPQAVSERINSGVFEALLTTPTGIVELLVGLNAFDLLLATLRAVVLLGAAALLGATIIPGRVLPAAIILALIVAAHMPIGVLGAAMILAFRTTGPLPKLAVTLSALLGGVYYPTSVVPSWLRLVSDVLPLSYGLRALRRVLLQNASLVDVAPDVAAVAAAAVLLAATAALAFSYALRHARAQGTLTQY